MLFKREEMLCIKVKSKIQKGKNELTLGSGVSYSKKQEKKVNRSINQFEKFSHVFFLAYNKNEII